MDHLMERDRHLADLMRSAQDGDYLPMSDFWRRLRRCFARRRAATVIFCNQPMSRTSFKIFYCLCTRYAPHRIVPSGPRTLTSPRAALELKMGFGITWITKL